MWKRSVYGRDLCRVLSCACVAMVAATVQVPPCSAQDITDSAAAGSAIATGLAETSTATTVAVQIDDLTLTVPDGINVTKIAGEPLITWPVLADWDPQGRLVVVESGGVSRPIEAHNEKRLHRVVRLVDENGDGTFDARILAADQLPFAVGVLCAGNDLLVSAPPEILRLSDQDGDGYCEQREVWLDAETITGCANDLHGPYEGRDGWIYWTKGAFAEQTHELPTGITLRSSAAHIFRRRLEGGPVEPVMTGGMDNPVEVAFLPSGERFFTSTFLQHPSDGLRDGIAHAVYGGVYGKDHHVINGHLRTGDLMPIMTQLGAAAPAGLAYLESQRVASQVFPQNEHVLAAALFNHHKVTLNSLTPDGAGFRAESRDLLVADRIDFHPTEVIEDADGSLIVIDTGGWYDLCCPSSHVDQKTAAGGIYRITRQAPHGGSPSASSPSPADAPIDDLIAGLSSVSTVARRAAIAELIQRADEATPALIKRMNSSDADVHHRTDSLWALCRIGSPTALAAVTTALADDAVPPELACAAAHAVSIHHFKPAAAALQQLVTSQLSPQVRRAAAEALGRVGSRESVAPLMQAIGSAREDRILEHSLLYAMMELDQPDAVREFLESNDPVQRRASLIVLDQASPRTLPSAMLFAAARSDNDALSAAALGVLGSRPESPPAAQTLAQIDAAWSAGGSSQRDADLLRAIIAGWGQQPEIQSLMANWIKAAPELTASRQSLLLKLLRGYTGRDLPEAWSTPLAAWFAAADQSTAVEIAEWLRGHTADTDSGSQLSRSVLKRAMDRGDSPESVVSFLAALPQRTSVDETLSAVVVDAFLQTDRESLVLEGSAALQRVRLTVGQAQRLVDALDHIAPLQLPVAIAAVNSQEIDALDAELLDSLRTIRAARTLTDAQIVNLYRNRSSALQQSAVSVVEHLKQPAADVRQHVTETLDRLQPGDRLRGYQVFRSSKAACSACHKIGYVGTSIGPDLSRIGQTRTRYDLLEAILHPSSRLEQSYQPVSVLTKDGLVHNGLIRHQTSQHVELVTGPNQVVTLNTADIEEQVPSDVSIMPKGLAEQITIEELSDLIALLEAAR